MINPYLSLRTLFAAALIAFAGNAMAQSAPPRQTGWFPAPPQQLPRRLRKLRTGSLPIAWPPRSKGPAD